MSIVRSNEELNKYAESKAPLTGTGASGTWGISVTGNAGTVTNGVYTTGDQTIAGVKTFSSSPIVPNATTATQSIAYGQAVKLTGDETISGTKTFSSSPIVPTPTTGTQAVNKDYVDSLKTIATGTATFYSTTNNINLTGIGIGVEIGDVIKISGAEDAKNNSEFTIEVITDNNNIIVNQAHANKGTAKNVANRSSDTGVTVKLLAKWYNAPIGLGQGWVDFGSGRVGDITYTNPTGRTIYVSIFNIIAGENVFCLLYVDDIFASSYRTMAYGSLNVGNSLVAQVPANSTYRAYISSLNGIYWRELR